MTIETSSENASPETPVVATPTADHPSAVQVVAGFLLAMVVVGGAVIASYAAITPYDFDVKDDWLYALKLLAVLVVIVVIVALLIAGLVAGEKRVVPTTTWLGLLAILWSLASFDNSYFAWKVACLAGPTALTLVLLGIEVSRFRRPR